MNYDNFELRNGCNKSNVTNPCSILKTEDYCHTDQYKYNCGPCRVSLDQNYTVWNTKGLIEKGFILNIAQQYNNVCD